MSYYDILGVPRTADEAAVRKGYLRASLRCHPDKNPGREAEAKAEFIKVGQAYAVLRDAKTRIAYDRELAAGSRPQRSQSRPQPQKHSQSPQPQTRQRSSIAADDKDFDNFMRMFDETVSGMSEEELQLAMGAAAVVGGVIGSIFGAKVGKGNSVISTAASMLGSALASNAAGRLVREVHEDSKQRTIERRVHDAAIARGETPQETTSKERVYQDAGLAFQRAAASAVSDMTRVGMNSFKGNETLTGSVGGGGSRQGRFSFAQAAELACEAARVYEAVQQSKGASTSKR